MNDQELEEAFPLTLEEEKLVASMASLPKVFGPMSPADWQAFAMTINRNLIEAYANRDIKFRRLMELAHTTSLGCSARFRLNLLGLTAAQGLGTKQNVPHRNGKRPRYPAPLKIVAVDMVERIKERSPGTNLPRCIEQAIQWLEVVRLFSTPPNVRTVQGWYTERRKRLGRGTPQGRPRKAKTR